MSKDSFFLKNLQILQSLQYEPLRKAPLVFDSETHPESKPYVEVWRMQNEKGEGPYWNNKLSNEPIKEDADTDKEGLSMWMDEPHNFGTGRPSPAVDEGFSDNDAKNLWQRHDIPKKYFAFESLDHLNSWFTPEEQKRLAHHGFKPTKVKAKKVWSSGKQVFYEPYKEVEALSASESATVSQNLEKNEESIKPLSWKNSYSMHAPQKRERKSISPKHIVHKEMGLKAEDLPEEHLKNYLFNEGKLIYDPGKGFVLNRRIINQGGHLPLMMKSEILDKAAKKVKAPEPQEEPQEEVLPLTVKGNPVQPNPHIRFGTKSTLDQNTGMLHTPRGSFKISVPDKSDSDYQDILRQPDIQNLHTEATKNWMQLNSLLRAGKLPDEAVAQSALFSILSANIPVPSQELMFSRLHDTTKQMGLDVRSPQFAQAFEPGGEGREQWKLSDSPVELPKLSRDYWEKIKPVITQTAFSPDTLRDKGDIIALGPTESFSNRLMHYPAFHDYFSYLARGHRENSRALVAEMMRDKANPKLPKDHPMKLGVGLGTKTSRYAASMMGGGNTVVPDTHFVRHTFGLDSQKDSDTSDYLKSLLWEPKNHHLLENLDLYYHKHHPAVKFVQDKYFNGHPTENAIFPAFWLHWLTIAPHEAHQGIGKPYAAKNLTNHAPFFDAVKQILDKHGLDSKIKKNEENSNPVWARSAAAMVELEHKLGSAPASLAFYAYIVPQLLNEKSVKRKKSTEFNLNKTESGIKLVHYSRTPSLKEIRADKMGTDAPSQEYKRGLPEIQRAYYYLHGTEPEDIVKQGAKSKYTVTLDPQHKLYDLATDKHGLVKKAITENMGAWNTDHILKTIKDNGFHGFYNSASPLPNAVALFYHMPVEKEEML
jgi:hypothetical protein